MHVSLLTLFLLIMTLMSCMKLNAQNIIFSGFEDTPCYNELGGDSKTKVVLKPARMMTSRDVLSAHLTRAVIDQNYDKSENGMITFIVLVDEKGNACLSRNERSGVSYINTIDFRDIIELDTKWEPPYWPDEPIIFISLLRLKIVKGRLKSVFHDLEYTKNMRGDFHG